MLRSRFPARALRAGAILLTAGPAFALLSCASAKQPQLVDPEEAYAAAAVQEQTPDPAEVAAAALEELLARLETARAGYLSGIELIASGEEVPGEVRLVESGREIRGLAEDCAANPLCDMDLVLDTFDELLSEQAIALKQQSFQMEELQADLETDTEREPGTSPFVASMPELGKTVSLLRGTDLRDLIALNGPVNAAIDDWLTWMRPNLIRSYENYQFLRDRMAPVYEEEGLPEALLFAMVATESGGKVHAYSRAGAAGPLQFMRYTGKIYGLTVEDGFDMRLDPTAATRANVAYLNDQLEALNNSLEKALAAYNGGERRMERLHRRYSGASLWDSRVYYSLPRETREYVPRVLAAAWLFLHAEDYGLEFPRRETGTTRVTVQEEIALGELAICLGQALDKPDGWFRTLRNLNPRLEPGDRIKAGEEITIPAELAPVYEERCLEGELLARARVLHDANYPDEPEMIVYTVRRGDTLGKIASRFRCASIRQLADINRIRPPRYVIQPGQKIKIPPCS